MGHYRLNRLRRKSFHRLFQFTAEPQQERPRQQCDVWTSLSKWRHGDSDDAKPVIEIFSEPAFADGLLKIDVGRRKNPGIDGDRLLSTQSLYLVILQESKQLDLQPERDIPNFVQEQRAALRAFDAPFSLLHGSCEGSFFIAEQLTLQERLWNRPTVDRDEGSTTSSALAVDRSSDQLLSSAALSSDQHRNI